MYFILLASLMHITAEVHKLLKFVLDSNDKSKRVYCYLLIEYWETFY